MPMTKCTTCGEPRAEDVLRRMDDAHRSAMDAARALDELKEAVGFAAGGYLNGAANQARKVAHSVKQARQAEAGRRGRE